MTQHYVNPDDVGVIGDDPELLRWLDHGRRNRLLHACLERDGQIVPMLVREVSGRFVVTDYMQAERLGALRMAAWPTILVETDWDEDDL